MNHQDFYPPVFSSFISGSIKGILKLREKLGNDFVYIIGNNMKYLNEILDEELEDE